MSNEHVDLLNRHQPWDADSSENFFESGSRSLEVRTRALETLCAIVGKDDTRLVILTGDAGHGKTHLCGLLLAELTGQSIQEVANALERGGLGDSDLAPLSNGRQLRVITDLSATEAAEAGPLLLDAISADARVTVACANEGQLRAAAESRHNDDLEALKNLLDASVQRGHIYSDDRSIALLNLNHQSVVAQTEQAGIFDQVAEQWIFDDDKWSSCLDCEHKELCPILNNRDRLAQLGPEGGRRSDGVKDLLRIVEWTGHTITVRELLIFVAHLVTGGLDCTQVHEKVAEQPDIIWQWPFLYHQTIFGDSLSDADFRFLALFAGVRKLDPGKRAIRMVDDYLDPSERVFQGTFRPPFHAVDAGGGKPKSKDASEREADDHRRLWRAMRRFDFFESFARPPEEVLVSPSRRVGLEEIETYEKVLAGELASDERAALRRRLIGGFEAVQGVHRSGSRQELYVTHRAFTSVRSSTSVVEKEIDLDQIRVMSLSAAWEERSDSDTELITNGIDWSDRRVIVSLGCSQAPPESCIELLLHEFEFLLAADTGLQAPDFYAEEVRRLVNALGRVEGTKVRPNRVIVFSGIERTDLFIEDGKLQRSPS